MDVDANLREQLEIAKQVVEIEDRKAASADAAERAVLDTLLTEKASRLSELVIALDEYIVGGGFLPERWSFVRGFGL